MYVYFKEINSVLTCEKDPQFISVDAMKQHHLEHMCDKWIKTELDNGNFTLYYSFNSCVCDNSCYMGLPDYKFYACYSCGKRKNDINTRLYLQNSGCKDFVWADKLSPYTELCEVAGYPNVYQWANSDYKTNAIWALHNKSGVLSDGNVFGRIDKILHDCIILFTDIV